MSASTKRCSRSRTSSEISRTDSIGMELMQDCNRRIPFDSALKVGPRVDAAATRHGLILRVVGDRLVLAPPLIIEVDEINEIGRRLRRALDEVANDLASK